MVWEYQNNPDWNPIPSATYEQWQSEPVQGIGIFIESGIHCLVSFQKVPSRVAKFRHQK